MQPQLGARSPHGSAVEWCQHESVAFLLARMQLTIVLYVVCINEPLVRQRPAPSLSLCLSASLPHCLSFFFSVSHFLPSCVSLFSQHADGHVMFCAQGEVKIFRLSPGFWLEEPYQKLYPSTPFVSFCNLEPQFYPNHLLACRFPLFQF